MKIQLLSGLLLAACLTGATSCSDDEHIYNPYENWAARNADFYQQTLQTARQAIAQSQARWGNDWADHCAWRIYGSTSLPDSATAKSTDSICVEILESGTGSGCPLYNDTVLVNYRGTLIPTTNNLGDVVSTVFDHSGLSEDSASVFNPLYAVPAKLPVGTSVRGFATALQHMHIGDLWRVYVPQELGYGAKANGSVPAYSCMRFDVQLKAYYRPGTPVPDWQ